MLKLAKVREKSKAPKRTLPAYTRFNLKMLYISSEAMMMIPDAEYISIRVDGPGHMMLISPESIKTDSAFKLSHVNETRCARRIETNNALLSILDAGFPKWALGRRMPVTVGLDGSLIVDLRPQIELGCTEGKENVI